MSAPTLADRVLAAIATATSKRPSNAADVLALVGGKEAAFWDVVEQLWRDARITGANIYRPKLDAEPWLGIWPTGIPQAAGVWTGPRLSYLFVRHDPVALAKARAPRSRPRKAKEPAA